MPTASDSLRAPVNLIEKIFAAAMLAVCLMLLARLFAGERRRARFDAAWRAFRAPLRRWLRRRAKAEAETGHARAERLAREAIERARQRADGGAWDGNVYRPGSFTKKKKKRDLH